MKRVPQVIGNAPVLFYTPIDSRHNSTGRTEHVVAGKKANLASGLAICKYQDSDGYYLFGCDSEWNAITDTWHQTIEDAKAQAEFEYAGTSNTWETPNNT